jgi:diguanylate cyclase (GGDEF)-like protein/PAS domain S-box-containing protein
MNTYFLGDDERVAALCALDILDTAQEPRFDRLTRLAAAALSAPIALVSLVDRDRQWFKSRVGLDALETPRPVSFCSHAVAARDMLVVHDAAGDARFAANPLVLGAPHIRFYAGQPVFSADGHAVGTLCVIDTVPRAFSDADRGLLRDLATLVELELNNTALVRQNQALAHEIARREALEASLRASEERIRTTIESSFNAFVGIDDKGLIVDWNSAAERTFGWSRLEAIGRAFAAIVPGSAPLDQRIELPALRKDGEQITVEMTLNAFQAGAAVFHGAFMHDISGRFAVRRTLEQKQELLDAVLDTVDMGVIACSARGELTLFNTAARELHGLPPEAIDPRDWAAHYDLFAADGVTLLESADIPLFRALQGETVKDVAMVVAPVGLPRRMLLASGRPLVSASGEPLGAVVALKDITDLNESQRQLMMNEQRLRAITENLPALIGQVDKEGRFTFLNSQAARFYGKASHELVGQAVQSAYSYAEFQKIAPHVQAAMGGQQVVFEDELMAGAERLAYHATHIPDGDGGFYAMAFDITARKDSETRQRDSEERLRTITDNLPVLIAYLDPQMRYKFANALYEDWFGVSREEMIGRTIQQVFGTDAFAKRKKELRRCLEGHTVQTELDVVRGDDVRVVHSVYIPHIRDGVVLGAYVLSTDVTATRQYETRLKALANTDALTALPNRRAHELQLAAAIGRAARSGGALALMYLDIDHFKLVNDTHGHAGGDEMLKAFADRLRATVRATDTVCRLAGDEFTIILEGVRSPEDCAALGATIVAAMQAPFAVAGQLLPVTTSIGIAWSGAAQATAEQLARDADAALYQAKAAGRNRVSLVRQRATCLP